MPINRRGRFRNQPSLVQRIHDLLRQRALLQVRQIILQVVHAADTNDDAVIAIQHAQRRMVDKPPHRRLDHRQAMLLDRLLDKLQRTERLILVVAGSVHRSRGTGVAETALLGYDVLALDLAREKTAGERVIDHDVEAEAAAGMNELGLD